MKKEENNELQNLKYIADDKGYTALETLKTEIAKAIETGTENFSELMGVDNYTAYVTSIKECVLNPSEPVEERKKIYEAVLEGCLIGRFA